MAHSLFDEIRVNSDWTSLDFATATDDAGEIIGTGEIGGQSHAFLLGPRAAG